MDQELIAYFDQHFREMSRQIESLREETTQQIGGLRVEVTQQIQGLREETTQRFEEVTESIRHTRVMVEGVRSDLQLLAEGMMGTNESLGVFRTEVAQELKEVRSLIGLLPYPTLESRVHKLEVWRETRERDPLDIIREKFGKTL